MKFSKEETRKLIKYAQNNNKEQDKRASDALQLIMSDPLSRK